ncbi:MAG: oxidoreductase [Planctomycetaceae bacterium]
MSVKPKLAVFKFASCDGCQLSLLAAEDELLTVAGVLHISYFLEATSHIEPGPYDIALVEGSITTAHDAERIQQVRRDSKFLITLGACATAGGIQALRNWGDSDEYVRSIYASPEYISTLATSTAISDHVSVDFELRGCPINKAQLIEVLQAVLAGRRPRTPMHSVCLDCKRSGTVCVTVARGVPCLGPVTQSGCGAICPSYTRGCYGCFGPAAQPNLVSLTHQLTSQGVPQAEIVRSLRSFNSDAPEFRHEGDRLARLVELTCELKNREQDAASATTRTTNDTPLHITQRPADNVQQKDQT